MHTPITIDKGLIAVRVSKHVLERGGAWLLYIFDANLLGLTHAPLVEKGAASFLGSVLCFRSEGHQEIYQHKLRDIDDKL